MEENRREDFFHSKKISDSREDGNLINLRQHAKEEKQEEPVQSPYPDPIENIYKEKPESVREKKAAKEKDKPHAAGSFDLLDFIAEWGVYLLAFLMPLFILPCTFEVFEFSKFFLLAFGAVALFFVWILDSIFIKKRICFSGSFITWSFLAFIVVLFVSSLFSIDKPSSFLGYSGNFADSFAFYLGLFIYYLLFTSLSAVKGSERVISRTVNALILSAFLVSLISIPFYFVTLQLPFFGTALAGFNTASGYFHAFAVYLLAMLFILMYDLSLADRKLAKKAFDSLAIVLIIVNLVFIDWPLVYAVIFILCAVLMVFGGALSKESASARSEQVILAMMVFSSLLFISSVDITEIMSGKISTGSSSISSFAKNSLRVNIQGADSALQNGLGMKESLGIANASFSSRPILGSGPGTYHYDFFKFKSADFNHDGNWSTAFNKAYNEVLEKVSTVGVLGVLSYLLLVIMAFLLLLKDAGRNRNVQFILAAFLSLLLFQFLFLETALLKFLFVVLLAIAASVQMNHSKAQDAGAKRWQGMAAFDVDSKNISGGIISFAGMIAILLCSTSLIVGFQIFRAEAQYTEAVRSAMPENLNSERLEEVVKLNPYKGDYAAGIARIYLARAYKLVASTDSNDQAAANKLAIEANKALGYAQKAVDISPNDLYLWENYGFVCDSLSKLNFQGGEEMAIKGYEAAAALAPNDPVVKNEIGKAYLALYQKSQGDQDKKDNLQKAEEWFKKVQEMKNDYPEATLNLALTYYYENDKKKSLQEVDKAGQMTGLNIRTAVEIGRMYYNLGDSGKAKEALGLVVSTDANNADAHYILGSVYKDEKNYKKALEEFNKVAENNPDNEALKKDVEYVKNLMNGTGEKNDSGSSDKSSGGDSGISDVPTVSDDASGETKNKTNE